MIEHIWLLSGFAGSGKDTAAVLLANLLGSQAIIGSFAGTAKDAVAAKFNIDRRLLDTQEGKATLVVFPTRQLTLRELLIEYAEREKRKAGNPAVWAERIAAPITPHWILSDWRFLDELLYLRMRFPQAAIHTLRIERPCVHSSVSHTEHELDSFDFEHHVDNSGSLLHLANQIQIILETIGTCMTSISKECM